eukprot:Gb_28300 [translate_table: standard]
MPCNSHANFYYILQRVTLIPARLWWCCKSQRDGGVWRPFGGNGTFAMLVMEFIGVKALVEKGLVRLPKEFIRPLEERPIDDHELTTPAAEEEEDDNNNNIMSLKININVHEIPAIDFGAGDQSQVVNHGIPEITMEKMMQAAREFFALPEEEKMIYFSAETSSKVRYASSFNSKKDKILSWRDFIRYSCHPLNHVISLWPRNPPTFREASMNYCTQMHELLKRLLGVITQSLGLSESYIENQYEDYSQVMVCNYYPACPDPKSTLGVGRHTDPGWVTVLMQDDVGGLQFFHGGHWVLAKSIPNALILSNGKYKSVEHRAIVNGSRDRLSVGTTYGPSLDSILRPSSQLVDDFHPAVYRECLYEEYMRNILSGSLEEKHLVDFHAFQITDTHI